MHKTCTSFCANLNANGCELVGIAYLVFERIDGCLYFIKVGIILLLLVGAIANADGCHLAIEVHILGVQPVDFQVWENREAVLAHFADEGVLAVHAVVIIEANGVEAGCHADAEDLADAELVLVAPDGVALREG